MRRLIVTLFRAVRALARGAAAVARGFGGFARRQVGSAREKGGGGEAGMMRLLDLHAASCAGDTLVVLGLAGALLFDFPPGEGTGRLAVHLAAAMVPFVLLAPFIGPALDRVKHGRRYALAASMLGRAVLVWVASNDLGSPSLYPLAFGILFLSRAYGVTRGAVLPRLLPDGLGLVEAGARATLFGTAAGAVALPVGLLTLWAGPDVTLRAAAVVFLIGTVWAMRVPPRGEGQAAEKSPGILRPGPGVITGRLLWTNLLGAVALRLCCGFLAVHLALRAHDGGFPSSLKFSAQVALIAVAVAFGAGTVLATGYFARKDIARPMRVQITAFALTLVFALAATAVHNLATAAALCAATAAAAGSTRLAVDAVVWTRVPPADRATAFAHTETALIVAWIAGAGLGLVPLAARAGTLAAAAVALAAGIAAVIATRGLRTGRLTGDDPRPAEADSAEPPTVADPEPFATGGENDAPAGYHLYRPGKRSRAEDYPDNP